MGPETIAAALSVVVVIALVAFLGAGGLGAGAAEPPASPTPSVAGGGSAAPPSPSAGASATRAPWATAADTILATDERLLDVRDDLRAALAADAAPTSELVRQLRAASTLLLAVAPQTRAAADAGLPAEIAADLDAVHEASLDIVSVALDASIQNDAAYRDGAADFVEAAAPLPGLMTRLAEVSGLPVPLMVAEPTPSPAP